MGFGIGLLGLWLVWRLAPQPETNILLLAGSALLLGAHYA